MKAAQTQDWNILSKYFAVPKSKSPAQVAFSKAMKEERRLNKNAMAKARKLAEKLGVTIERDGVDGWWVSSKLNDTDTDPLDGNHFCTDGREVLQAVETLAKELS
jgi:pyruvate/2-oxoglutarate dehydrogenase complex dihydrolipoamide acyltransferase (E2) component